MNKISHERKIITKDKLSYELNYEDKTANVVNNEQASGQIFIPRSIEYGQDKFVVKIIKQKSFENSNTIKSIKFMLNSEVNVIEKEAFLNSTIEFLQIPKSIFKLEEGWCRGTSKLKNIQIDSNNEIYINVDNKMIVGKSDKEKLEYDELVFVRRDIKTLLIPSFINKLCKYCLSETLIENIYIPSNIIEIGEGAFYNNNKLKKVEFYSLYFIFYIDC